MAGQEGGKERKTSRGGGGKNGARTSIGKGALEGCQPRLQKIGAKRFRGGEPYGQNKRGGSGRGGGPNQNEKRLPKEAGEEKRTNNGTLGGEAQRKRKWKKRKYVGKKRKIETKLPESFSGQKRPIHQKGGPPNVARIENWVGDHWERPNSGFRSRRALCQGNEVRMTKVPERDDTSRLPGKAIPCPRCGKVWRKESAGGGAKCKKKRKGREKEGRGDHWKMKRAHLPIWKKKFREHRGKTWIGDSGARQGGQGKKLGEK